MALYTQQEYDIDKRAHELANNEPMGNHADGCPYLINNRKRNCECNCYTFARNRLRKEANLPRD